MNIVILNWRDPKNPLAGGAEKLNLQILKTFTDRGDNTTWYAKSVRDLPKEEIYKGIRIIRFGNIITHLIFFPIFLYSGKFGKVDFLIDCVHGIGYISNIFAPFIRKRILICEVAQNIWDEMIPFPGNKIGKFIEKIMFMIYSQNKFWTISKSTFRDLRKMGIPVGNIEILPMGFDASKAKKISKTKNPTALFVGRLAEMKGIKDAIVAVAQVNSTSQNKWRLNVIGRGEENYEKELKQLIAKLKMTKYINFLGFVIESIKFREMAKAWVLLVPSSREGWGMIVGEANYVGTQVIAYRSPGLIDSVAYYSKQNVLIEKNPAEIESELAKINKPNTIKSNVRPGWNALHKKVLDEIYL